MHSSSNFSTSTPEPRGTARSAAPFFLLSGVALAEYLLTNSAPSGGHALASLMDPGLLLPAAPLMLGLAWLNRVTKILHPHEYETVYIGSDPNTLFKHSTVVGDHHHEKPAAIVPKPHHPDWAMADEVFTELKDCHWIADESSITLQEAVSGGKYTFERHFTLPHELEDLVSADLLVIVDEYCTPTVNGHLFERKGGTFDLLSWDLGHALQSGENHISFDVENSPAVAGLTEDPRWQEWNPYGLKYLIRIVHPK